jgi:hypothetical protein
MLKTLAVTLGMATALLATSIFATAETKVITDAPGINRTVKEDRAALLVPVPNSPAKRDRASN